MSGTGSTRWTRPTSGRRWAPGWGFPSSGGWWSSTGGGTGWKASRDRAAASGSACRCGRGDGTPPRCGSLRRNPTTKSTPFVLKKRREASGIFWRFMLYLETAPVAAARRLPAAFFCIRVPQGRRYTCHLLYLRSFLAPAAEKPAWPPVLSAVWYRS